MEYQTFRGADVNEALEQVKAALGADALVKSTRQVPGRRAGSLGRSFVEVTAAAPDGAVIASPFSNVAYSERHSASSLRARARPRPVVAEPPTDRKDFGALEREVEVLREMVQELSLGRPPRERVMAYLSAAGVEGTLARHLSAGMTKSSRANRQDIPERLRERLSSRISILPNLIEEPGLHAIACVGPAGVGKTTTLAKLAARARLELGRSLAVISLDTFRVGAVEQWKRYAQLIGFPFAVAHDEATFRRVLAEQTADIVLIDTAGRSASVPDRAVHAAGMAAKSGRAACSLLVLPAWLRARDAARIRKVYDEPAMGGAVLTKLDETDRAGGVLHALLPTNLAVAFLCDGPRVPEDLRAADAAVLSGCILRRDLWKA